MHASFALVVLIDAAGLLLLTRPSFLPCPARICAAASDAAATASAPSTATATATAAAATEYAYGAGAALVAAVVAGLLPVCTNKSGGAPWTAVNHVSCVLSAFVFTPLALVGWVDARGTRNFLGAFSEPFSEPACRWVVADAGTRRPTEQTERRPDTLHDEITFGTRRMRRSTFVPHFFFAPGAAGQLADGVAALRSPLQWALLATISAVSSAGLALQTLGYQRVRDPRSRISHISPYLGPRSRILYPNPHSRGHGLRCIRAYSASPVVGLGRIRP